MFQIATGSYLRKQKFAGPSGNRQRPAKGFDPRVIRSLVMNRVIYGFNDTGVTFIAIFGKLSFLPRQMGIFFRRGVSSSIIVWTVSKIIRCCFGAGKN